MSVTEPGAGGPARHSFVRCATAVLLISCAIVPTSVTAATAQPKADDPNREIIVIGPPLFRDLAPERELDQDAIESYAASTVDELLGEVQVELGEEAEQPLILVNGKRINDLSEIGALPVEVLRSLQVLPRGSAVRLGGTSGQRVINIALNGQLRSATVTAAAKTATEGDYSALRGEGILTKIKGDMRANVTVRGRGDSRLFESDRGIVQPDPRLPFATTGNAIGFPNTSGEIDPLLSAAAGTVVTVAPVPNGVPSLAAFAAGANSAAVTDLGRFRTLRPSTRNYDVNGTFASPIAPWLNASATVRFNRYTSRSVRGLPSALFVLPASNDASPFSRTVGLAYFGLEPFHSRSVNKAGDANLTFNADWGAWAGNLNVRHQVSRTRSQSERQTTFGNITLADSFNPFADDPASLIGIRTDVTTSTNRTDLAELVLNGPAFVLPAGPVQATIEGRLASNKISGTSTFGAFSNQNVRQSEQSIRAAADIPITDGAKGIGDLSATAEIGRAHFSTAGTLGRGSIGLTWEPVPPLRLRASYEESEQPPYIQTLGGPVIVYEDVRVFDPLTGETVDVTQISGGNPNLEPQRTKIKRLTALLRLKPSINLQLNGEYTDTDRRNFVSGLPEASAAVMLAFPERYIRENGVLTLMDLRPVNFASDRERRLRWGFSMNAKVRNGTPSRRVGTGKDAVRIPSKPATFLQLTANHSVVFSDRIVIREGLAPVDLLGGGAIGIGGGRLRHQVDGTAALTSGGMGLRAGVTWRGASRLASRISGVNDTLEFSPVILINLRAFADMKRLLPDSKWARGLRLSLDVANLTNDRQRVRDSAGNTPLQYQPAYRDALGRTIEVELRKVF